MFIHIMGEGYIWAGGSGRSAQDQSASAKDIPYAVGETIYGTNGFRQLGRTSFAVCPASQCECAVVGIVA